MIKWTDINPTRFEELCYELIEQNGFKNIEWLGKGGCDRGRDITAVKHEEPLSGIRRERRWIVQCKRYVKAAPTKIDVESFLVAAREHTPDAVLLIITNTLSANTKDWLKAVTPQYTFDIFVWEEKDLEREISIHRTKLRTNIKIVPAAAKPTIFYRSQMPGVLYMCGVEDLEEFGLYLLNDYGAEGNARWLKKYIDYLRHNEVDFYVEGEHDEDS